MIMEFYTEEEARRFIAENGYCSFCKTFTYGEKGSADGFMEEVHWGTEIEFYGCDDKPFQVSFVFSEQHCGLTQGCFWTPRQAVIYFNTYEEMIEHMSKYN